MSVHTRVGRGRRVRGAVVGVLAVALSAAGCAGSSDGGGGKNADTLIAYTGQAGDYQYNFNPWSPTHIGGGGTIFEPLFYYNVARQMDPVPRLGTAFQWNEDGTQLKITTRAGVKWTDGQKFTAADVAFTFNMIKKNKTINNTGYDGTAKAVDGTHVVVDFDKPAFMDGPQILGKFFIVPEHVWKKYADPATNTVKNPVGTGPYKLGDFKAQAFTLTANKGYWGGAPKVKNVRYIALSGNQSGADALKAGQVDWMTGPVPGIENVPKNYPGYQSITTPLNQTALFTCSNTDLGCKGPQTDPAVRKAIYYALDRTQVNKLAFDNTSSEISPGGVIPGRDKKYVSGKLSEHLAPMSPQLSKATGILEAAGYTKDSKGLYAKNGEELSLTVKVVSGWTDYITAVNTMAQQVKKAGIKLTMQQQSWNEWADARGQGHFELLIDALTQGPAPDPYFALDYFFDGKNTAEVGKTANPNFSRFKNAKVDTALARLKTINQDDTAARQAQLDIIQTEIEKSLPYIPVLTGGTTSEFNTAKFTGWPSANNLYAFPAVWSTPDDSQVYLHLKPAK
ncbi:ABC transporter substrate-binding protein [Streptomyces odontomachi]|uniref:ABC transporter substrate-binding protein n=1 Tax=Streptomyces odontomachi TaxID=2944940 RepID=UPI0021093BF8|nr:ABC transporter substrate-binding protein [Streptomyces sp. ODS25]